MTREEAIKKWIIPALKNTWNEKKNTEILKALEQEPCEDWHDIPSGEMTLEQARQAVRELRKYVMDKIDPCKM